MTLPLPITAGFVTTHAPPSVSLKCSSPHAFRVLHLGRPTRWFRQIGYTVPILSGEPAFDARWAVEADDHEFAQALVHERAARAAVVRLDALGCWALGHSRRRLVAVITHQGKTQQEHEQQEQQVREQLEVLDGAITRLCRVRGFPHNGGRLRVVLATVGSGLALIAGLVGLAVNADELVAGELGRIVLWSLLFSLPLMLLYGIAMARLLAGRSSSHRDLLVVLLTALFALPALGMGTAVTVNRVADEGPPAVHRAPVLELIRREGDNHHVDVFAVVPAWRADGGPTQRIELSHAQANQVVTGTSVLVVTTSPGRFGAERLLDVRVENGAAGS